MAELNRQQHEQLGGTFSTEPYFGGFIQTLGGLYVPAKAEQVDGVHYHSIVNLADSIERRLGNAFPCYVYKSDTDTALQFSVKPLPRFYFNGSDYAYAGATGVAGLVAGSLRYIWLEFGTAPAMTLAVGAAWPGVPHIRLDAITPPASGHWLEQHRVRHTQSISLVPAGTMAGSNFAAKEFAYNTASPLLVDTVPTNSRVIRVSIRIETVFNGGTPTLSIGDSGDNARLMATADNDPKTLDVYEATPIHKYGSTTAVNLYITPSGASQGAGVVILEKV